MKISHDLLWEVSRKLIGFDTVSSKSNLNISEYLADLFDDCGFNVQVHREKVENVVKASVVAYAGPPIEGGLIISGHMDVVPYEEQSGWTKDPLSLVIEEGRIFGRGVSDMKIFLAQCISACKKLDLSKLQRPIVFVFTCDEELSCQGSKRLCSVLPELLKSIPLPQQALIGEPTNYEIYCTHKGYARFVINVIGKGGHSSKPDLGLSAIYQMACIVQIIENINHTKKNSAKVEDMEMFPECPYTSFNFGTIRGGSAANMIAEKCCLEISYRTIPKDNPEEIFDDLCDKINREIIFPMKSIFSDVDVVFQDLSIASSLKPHLSKPLLSALQRATGSLKVKGASFATDGGHFQAHLGIDSYICGPGLLSEAHQIDESIPVENYLRGTEIVLSIIRQVCGGYLSNVSYNRSQ